MNAFAARWQSPLLLALFFVSGFSALIYQSIWSQYLGLLLGHAAYAQTLVLVMFMGGMAGGAWWVSRRPPHRPLAVYAGVELLIGIAGLGFHALFQAYTGFSQGSVLPALQGSVGAALWQWGSAALLIAPQTLLLGATFPLIASGVLRLRAEGDAESLGGLYFTNSLGAAVGVLVATFALLPTIGLPGAMSVAGALNLLLAAATYAISRGAGEAAPMPAPAQETAADTGLLRLLLAATFLSSAASFAYEIGWVRLLQQALGTTLHAFELMLAAFIGGMALGGLWVRKRGAGIQDVLGYAAWVQVLMGLCALASVPLLAGSFDWVAWLLQALARSPEGYGLYSLATALTAMAVMLPAAFFAGMTLPLFTAVLLRRGAGERVIGQVYAANTVGAILGVGLTVHVLIPAVGISFALILAALADVLIGLVLLRRLERRKALLGAAVAAVLLAGTVLRWGLPDPAQQAAGVFRSGQSRLAQAELLFFKDGQTATIAVVDLPQHRMIATNGKPDAALALAGGRPSSDEATMRLLGLLPLALHAAPERVALIGWGSGLSTHTLLGSPLPKVVDTIEIEPAMWEGAKLFGEANARAYQDPRSQVHFEDARQFFSRRRERYDVIVSEPSNPWVSGVASLFTQEFYALARRHLRDEGLLVQWLHSYEMSDALLAQMVAALLAEFPHSELYVANTADLLIVARKSAAAAPLQRAAWQPAALQAELARTGLGQPEDLQVRYLGGPALLRSFVRLHAARVHSDFHPTVALGAPAQRFARQNATALLEAGASPWPLMRVLACRQPLAVDAPVATHNPSLPSRQHAEAVAHWRAWNGQGPASRPLEALLARLQGGLPWDEARGQEELLQLALATLAPLPAAERRLLWQDDPRWTAAEARMPPGARALRRLLAAAAVDDWAAVAAQAAALLRGGQLAAPLGEPVLVLGLLAELGQGKPEAVAAWEREFGARLPPQAWAGPRRLLQTWARHEPVCAAAAQR